MLRSWPHALFSKMRCAHVLSMRARMPSKMGEQIARVTEVCTMTYTAHAADESLFLLKDYHIQALTPKMQELVRNRPKVEDVIHEAE